MDSDITTVGLRRRDFGKEGKRVTVQTNCFQITRLPERQYFHYEGMSNHSINMAKSLTCHIGYTFSVAIQPSNLPLARNYEILSYLQDTTDPVLFNPKGVYDGQRAFYIAKDLGGVRNFSDIFASSSRSAANDGRLLGRRTYDITLTRVGSVFPNALASFMSGHSNISSEGIKLINAINLMLRMAPVQTMRRPTSRSVFLSQPLPVELGGGLELLEGLYQSVRPGMGKMMVNIDRSIGVAYRRGHLVDLCLEFLQSRDIGMLSIHRLQEPVLKKLKKFIKGIQVIPKYSRNGPNRPLKPKAIRGISKYNITDYKFPKDGVEISVEQYYKEQYQMNLRPNMICVEIGRDAVFPIEICEVVAGQLVGKQHKITPQQQQVMLKNTSAFPAERLRQIIKGLPHLGHLTSDYISLSGLRVDQKPLETPARVLRPPKLSYGRSELTPENGQWNLIGGLRFVIPKEVKAWAIIVYDPRFPQNVAVRLVQDLVMAGEALGYHVKTPRMYSENPSSGNISDHLEKARAAAISQANTSEVDLIVCILPPNAGETRNRIKHWGDVKRGIPTQIILSAKKHNNQYMNNLSLKINAKLGGINLVPHAESVPFLRENTNTLIFGADVSHGGPGADFPSFASVVASVDRAGALYTAQSSIQPARQEVIGNLKEMIMGNLDAYLAYRLSTRQPGTPAVVPPPGRVIFYRDGVSEGQFQIILDDELSQIRGAFQEKGLPPPKITFVVVGKRHHFRMFPIGGRPRDNCAPGTVVDSDVVNPYFQDYYLQSHAGLLGTSRPSHYTVLHDDNGFSADGLQALSYVLCHTYSRATKAVSIPAPVYYADLVCRRLPFHLNNNLDAVTSTSSEHTFQEWGQMFQPVHKEMAKRMYWM